MSKKGGFRLRHLGTLLLILLVGAGVGIWIYLNDYYQADAQARQYADLTGVPVYESPDFFACGDPENAEFGYIFYPGAKVETEAYLPYLLDVAAQGDVFCVALRPPLRLALFAPDAAAGVLDSYPQIKDWAVGGHSLGGVMAAAFAEKNPELVRGLILLASYPDADLSGSALRVLSVRAGEDRILNSANFESALAKLPPDRRYAVLAGGNHAQFGSYGEQKGDGAASISAEIQRVQSVALTLDFIRGLGN